MSLQAQAQAQRSARYSPQETIKVRNYVYIDFSPSHVRDGKVRMSNITTKIQSCQCDVKSGA